MGLEIAGRWPCKVDQSVATPCHIVLGDDPALKCPETAGRKVLAYFGEQGRYSMTFFLRFSLLSKAEEQTVIYITFWLVSALTFLTHMST